MPNATSYLTNHKATRILLVGDPGAGKSTACAHLALSPHIDRIFVLDLDDNWRGPLRQLPSEALTKIHIETLRDRTVLDAKGRYTPVVRGVPTAFPSLVRLLADWTDSETGQSFGDPSEWSERDALILDGLSGLAVATMTYTMYAASRMGQSRRIKDWGNAIERFEGVVQVLNSGLPCQVIATAHLARLAPEKDTADDDDEGTPKSDGHTRGGQTAPENFWMRYPSALGQKLPPRVGGYFEAVVQAKRVGKDLMARRVLKTTPDDDVDVKLPLRQKEIGGMEIPNTDLASLITKSCALDEAA